MRIYLRLPLASILALLNLFCYSNVESIAGVNKYLFASATFPTLIVAVGEAPFNNGFFNWLFDIIFPERCSGSWIDFSAEGFNNALKERVYGQPLIGLSNAVQQHWSNNQPAKALLLSMHGPPGTGKNYVSGILIRHLFIKDSKSKFYHLFSGTVHFPHKNQVQTYKDQIQAWVRGNVSICPKSVFVFDEVDKMPATLLDALKPFVDSYQHIDRVDYRRAIFIFLSNSGSDMISRYMLAQKKLGKDRSEVYSKLDDKLPLYLYDESNGPLRKSDLLKHHLVSRFIPFLPLERLHVTECIKDYLKLHYPDWLYGPDFIERVLNKLVFVPEREKFFSSTGCKRVADKVQLQMSIDEMSDKDKRRRRNEL